MRAYLRVAKRLVKEPHLPRPLRALLVFALAPIPGPVDEVALVIAAVTIAVFYRSRFKALVVEERARSRSETDPPADSNASSTCRAAS